MSTVSASYSQEQSNTTRVGLMIGIASWAMMFMTLLWGYVVYRMKASEWMAEYLTPQTQFLALINTIVLVASSLCFRRERLRWGAFILGCVFLFGQVRLWQVTWGLGMDYKSSIAGSIFYLLTGFHAIHIIGGLVAILLVCLQCFKGRVLFVKGVQYFWDLLLAVWVVLFGLIFIVK